MREALLGILNPLGEILIGAFGGIPLPWVRGVFVAAMVGLGIWVYRLGNRDSDGKKNGGNEFILTPRFWALVLLGLQTLLIFVFA